MDGQRSFRYRGEAGGRLVRDLHSLLQALLAERFHLTARRESREMRRYVLNVAKGGIRLAPNTSGRQTWSLGTGTLSGEKISMEMAATDLFQNALHLPVVNQTEFPAISI
jgi:uncharacterized protein (TIGR03435 family)